MIILPLTTGFLPFNLFLTESSHKKLLVSAEKTVGAQINDAEIKIAEVQKVGRKQFSKLTCALFSIDQMLISF